MTPVSWAAHQGSSFDAVCRRIAENGGCSVSTCPSASATSSSDALWFESPTARTLPDFFKSTNVCQYLLERHVFAGPMHLIEVDALDPKPSQRCLDFTAQAGGRANPTQRREAIALVPDQAALGEYVRAVGRREVRERRRDELLGVAEAVGGCGVDPVHAPFDGPPDCRDRVVVVLLSPPERPPAAAYSPGAEADPCDVHVRSAKPRG